MITLQTGSPNHPEINKRIICQKELYKVDPVSKFGNPWSKYNIFKSLLCFVKNEPGLISTVK